MTPLPTPGQTYWPPRPLVIDTSARLRWLLPLMGWPFAIAAGLLAVRLIGSSWSACDDLEPGGSFALLFAVLPGVTIVAWGAFAVGTLATIFFHPILRTAVGLALVMVVCLGTVAMLVPAYPADTYGPDSTMHANFPECGPRGLPTWWPSWLPSLRQ